MSVNSDQTTTRPDRPTHPVELIACDMDGTLLTEEFRLTETTREAVKALTDGGILFVLVSGRMVASLLPFHDELGLSTPVIAYNGAMIWDVGRQELIEHTPIPYEIAQEILSFGRTERFHVQYFWDDKFWTTERNPWLEVYETRTGLTASIAQSLDTFGPDRLPAKVQFITKPSAVPELVLRLRDRFGERLYVTSTLPEYVEMMHPDVSKGRALRRLGEILGVRPQNMLAVGDAQNDETMFEVAGFAVAMGNARDDVKRKAHFITTTHEENGVVHALETLGLLPDA